MDALSNVDRFVALLKLRLAERARAQRPRTAPAAKTRKAAASDPQARIAAIAAQHQSDERSLKRTVIEQVLADRLGNQLANEPRFQQIVEQVTDMIAADDELAGRLDEILRQARSR